MSSRDDEAGTADSPDQSRLERLSAVIEHGGFNVDDLLELLESYLLGEAPSLDRRQVADEVGVPLSLAEDLWGALGFAHHADDEIAFTPADVEALSITRDLVLLGILGRDSQAALVRTWGRAFARLAEWQTSLLTSIVADSSEDPQAKMRELITEVVPRMERLQSYIWRRHLVAAASRELNLTAEGDPSAMLAVCFVDIVGYTSQSKNLPQDELIQMVELFENTVTRLAVEHGGRVIKTIGDEVLFVGENPLQVIEVALTLTEFGVDEDDPFPQVRAGVAYGDVTSRLGDVFGPTVNVASRLTSVARPGSVLIDRGVYDVVRLGSAPAEELADEDERVRELAEQIPAYRPRKLRRISVKGYARLEAWHLKRPKDWRPAYADTESTDLEPVDADDVHAEAEHSGLENPADLLLRTIASLARQGRPDN